MTSPLVSVIIPMYNRGHSVTASIESVLGQKYGSLEVIVVDDGSTDNSLESLEPFKNRIRVIRQKNKGPSAARNMGVKHASGEIVAFLDSDDLWKPEMLQRQIPLLINADHRVPCCICNAETFQGGKKGQDTFETAGIRTKLKEGYWLNPSAIVVSRFILFNQVVVIRRDSFEKVGGFNENLRVLEDHDLAFRLSLLGPWGFVKEPLVSKFDGEDGLGVAARRNAIEHSLAWQRVYEGFGKDQQGKKRQLQQHIHRNLHDVQIEITALRMLERSKSSQAIAKSLLTLLRLKRSIQRNLPSWPKAHETSTLPT